MAARIPSVVASDAFVVIGRVRDATESNQNAIRRSRRGGTPRNVPMTGSTGTGPHPPLPTAVLFVSAGMCGMRGPDEVEVTGHGRHLAYRCMGAAR
jgi:hypothetical protein